MTRVMLLSAMGLAVIGTGLLAQVKPQVPPDVGAGRAAWFDISTTDLPRAREFYGKLFDWTFTAVAVTGQAFEIRSRGTTHRRLQGCLRLQLRRSGFGRELGGVAAVAVFLCAFSLWRANPPAATAFNAGLVCGFFATLHHHRPW